jgi:hypothetical protein
MNPIPFFWMVVAGIFLVLCSMMYWMPPSQRSFLTVFDRSGTTTTTTIHTLSSSDPLDHNNHDTNNNNNNNTNHTTMIHTFLPIRRTVPPVTTTFYAHGDVPYTRIQGRKLKQQMLSVPEDAEFIIHVGDIRMAGPNRTCTAQEYETVASLLRLSPVPVLILLGDNDAVDCPNRNEGLAMWRKEFLGFESRYWNHTFVIQRPLDYPENFAFQYKDVLFIGVNIVGEHANNETIHIITQRLTDQVQWVMTVMRNYQIECANTKRIVGRIVLFYHANPGPQTRPFFKPLRHFIGNDLNHTIPVLFLNGDAHRWMYEPRFYNESSLLRVTVTGLAVEPLLKVTIASDGIYHDPTEAFAFDRRLPPVVDDHDPAT